MTSSSYLLSFLTQILSIKLKIPHAMPTQPHPPPCFYQAGWNANQIRSNIYLYMPSILWTPLPFFKVSVIFNYLPRKKGLEVYII